MGNLLSTYTNNRDNNFNLIRFIAASLVLYSHSFPLTLGEGNYEPIHQIIGTTWANMAVDVFFITSGFLITSSYVSRNNLKAFAWARVLRIYPALIVATIFCIFLGLGFTTWSVVDYINLQTVRFFFKNTTLFFGTDYYLPVVFLSNPEGAVNGSLWTLPYEVWMYVILTLTLIIVSHVSKWIKFISVKNVIGFLGVFALCLYIFNGFQNILPFHTVRLFAMFFIGATFFVWREKIRLSSKWIFLGIPLLFATAINKDVFFVVYCLVLPFLVFYMAYLPSWKIRKFNEFGDYSYGMYIYAFPVQQSVVTLVPNVSVTTVIIVSFGVTLLLSMLSWHLIEKRFLRMKGMHVNINRFLRNIKLTNNE
jgi:peptidoglycan/LPS O-acetylase OafA/YrhL